MNVSDSPSRIFLIFFLLIAHLLAAEAPTIKKLAISIASERIILKQIPLLLKTNDGLERSAILTLRPNAKGNIILCHPASFNKEFLAPFEEEIFNNYNCLRFDFRRHGNKSNNQFATLGKHEIHEIRSAVNIIRSYQNIGKLPLFGFGISMGAAILIEAESQVSMFDGLILQAPFDCLKSHIRRSFRFFRIPLMDSLIFSPFSRYYVKKMYRVKLYPVQPFKSIKKIKKPIFLIHAHDDPAISFKAFQRLKEAGKSIIKTWTPTTGQHTALFTHRRDEYIKHCIDFLDVVHKNNFKMNGDSHLAHS